jgi:hypothetical protein
MKGSLLFAPSIFSREFPGCGKGKENPLFSWVVEPHTLMRFSLEYEEVKLPRICGEMSKILGEKGDVISYRVAS